MLKKKSPRRARVGPGEMAEIEATEALAASPSTKLVLGDPGKTMVDLRDVGPAAKK